MSELNFLHSNGNKVKLTTPDTLAADKTFKLPGADGSAGQFLKTDGSGALSFDTPTDTTGKVLQIKHAIKTDTQDFGNISQGAETTIPFVASITPSSSSNKILVQMMITMDNGSTHGTFVTAKKTTGGTTTEPAIGDAASNRHRVTTGTSDNATSTLRNINIFFVDTAGTTNQIDYGFTLSHNDNNPVTIYLNYHGGDSDYSYNGRGVSSIVLTEFEP